jgi:hypothetical protein
MQERHIPVPQEIYRHFKDKLYQIVTIAAHSETGEELVIYQALYGDFKIYARPLSMFLSKVDKEKYPYEKQEYRFEKVDRILEGKKESVEEKVPETKNEVIEEEVSEINNDLLIFLDADTFEEKKNLLVHMKDRMTDRLINDIAASLDVTVDEGDIDKRYNSLMVCISTLQKFECNRFK